MPLTPPLRHPALTQAHRGSVTTVHIFSAVSEQAHACQAATDLSVEAFREYASLLRQQLAKHAQQEAGDGGGGDDTAAAGPPPGSEGGAGGVDVASVSVRFFPLFVCALDSTTFVLPAGSAAAALAR